jgi:outer membrane protein
MLPVPRQLGRGIGALLALMALQVARGDSLAQLYEVAESADPTFQAAKYTLEAARQKRPEAFSALLPSLGASGSLGRTIGRTEYTGTALIDRTFNQDQWAVQLTQPVFHLDAWFAYDEARAEVAQAMAVYVLAHQDLILRLSRAYFDVLIAERRAAAARAQVVALNEQLNAASRSFQAGVGSVTDVDDTRSHAAQARAEQVAAANDVETAQAALEALLGAPAPRLDAMRSGATLEPPADSLESWTQRALSDDPAVKAAEAAVRSAQYDLDRSRSQRLPIVDLIAAYGGNYDTGNITEPVNFGTNVRDKQINLQVSMPLLDGGGMSARLAEARALHRKALAELTGARRQAVLDAKQAYSAIISGLSQVTALETALSAAQNAVKGNHIGYGVGLRINSDVLKAEQQLFDTTQDLEKARYDTVFQGLKLKAATGELEVQDLIRVSALMEPSQEGAEGR